MNVISAKRHSSVGKGYATHLLGAALLLSVTACKPEEATSAFPSPASPTPALSAASSPAASAAAPANPSAGFDAFPESLFRAPGAGEVTIKALQQATLRVQGDTISLQATGIDPSVLLPEIPFNGGGSIRLDITAPRNTNAQFFYLAAGQTTYDEKHSVVQPLKAGRNTVYFQLPDDIAAGQLRFDPGDAPGDYVIHGLEIRGPRP